MADSYYGDVETVIDDSGIKPGDLGYRDDDESVVDGLTKEEKLEAKIEKWLLAVKGIIDDDRKEAGITVPNPAPQCINDIANEIGTNKAKQVMVNRLNPTEKPDEYTYRVQDSELFTPQLQTRLAKCLPKPDKSSILAYATR